MVESPQTRPPPLVGFLDEVRPHGVALDIASHLIEIFIGLDGKRLVAALIDMAVSDAPPMTLPAGHVSDRQSLHEGREFAVVLRPQNQVPMIGHEDITANAHGAGLKRLGHDPFKRLIVGVFEKQAGSPHASIQYVVDNSAWSNAASSWHAG